MPNWCTNVLTVSGPEKDRTRFQEETTGKLAIYSDETDDVKNNILCFNALYPVPEDVIKGGYSEVGYHWQIDHWGCKWDLLEENIYVAHEGRILRYIFDTAWSPPVGWLRHVAKLFPTLTFTMGYEEPGMCFSGKCKLKGEQDLGCEHTEER